MRGFLLDFHGNNRGFVGFVIIMEIDIKNAKENRY